MPTPYFGEKRATVTFNAGIDLTTNQYKPVELYGSETVTAGTATANTVSAFLVGIQENLPASGSAATIQVCTWGVCPAVAGAAFTAGVALSVATNTGSVQAAVTATARIIGWSIQAAAAASEVVTIFVAPQMNFLR